MSGSNGINLSDLLGIGREFLASLKPEAEPASPVGPWSAVTEGFAGIWADVLKDAWPKPTDSESFHKPLSTSAMVERAAKALESAERCAGGDQCHDWLEIAEGWRDLAALQTYRDQPAEGPA